MMHSTQRWRLGVAVLSSCTFFVVVSFLCLAVLDPAAFSQGSKTANGINQRITHGPILGRPGAHSMSIWARTAQPGGFRVLYGLRSALLERSSKVATTRLENDNTGVVHLKGLKANTKYYYRVVAVDQVKTNQKPQADGYFVTLPDPKDYQGKHNPKGLFNFRFEYACGNNQSEHSLGPGLPTFKSMLKNLPGKIHFAILNGDWLYEDDREFTDDQWAKQVHLGQKEVPDLVKLAPTITGVWQNYKTYLSRGKPLAQWHRYIPSYFTADDHEILNDVNGCGEIGYQNRRAVFRDIALEAWYDYIAWSNPVEFNQGAYFGRASLKEGDDVLTDPKANFTKLDLKQASNLHVHWGTPDAGVNDVKLDKEKPADPNSGVYEIVKVLNKTQLKIRPAAKATRTSTYSIGRRNYYRVRVSNCEFFFLDTRSHRQKHDIKNPAKPGISIIGTQQRQWLLDGIAKSDADFIFVVSSVNFTIPHTGAGGMAFAAADKDDAWTVFIDERETLIRAFDKLKQPVFVLTGDLHNSFAIKITDNVWEFASGPHNSRNHPNKSEGGRPATGTFDSRGRKVDIRWSTFFREDVPQTLRHQPVYCVVQVNNTFNNPVIAGKERWVAYPHPQVVFQYHDGWTGDLLYAEAIRN